jgi:hypothetical protein
VRVLAVLSLITFASLPTAFGAEGFYRPSFFGSDRLFLENAQAATVIFDGRGDDGLFHPFANGFFISKDGHILTNHHVGTNCGGRNPSADYRDLSHPREYAAGAGFPCVDFRARVYPNTSREVVLQLEMIARPDQTTLDRGGDFIVLRARNYQPVEYVGIAHTQDFPFGTPYYMIGYPPETSRGNSSVLIRKGAYSDIAVRGEYRVAYGEIVPKPDDYLNANNPVPYFVGNADGAPGTSGSLILSHAGNFLGYVQGPADPRGLPERGLCLRDGVPAGMDRFYCGALINYQRATWILDRMDEMFPNTIQAILRANLRRKAR